MTPSSRWPKVRSRLFQSCSFLLAACWLLSGESSAAPSISLSKKSGPPTSKILVSGRGFKSHVGVDIFFDTKDKALVVTNRKGEFHDATIHAPRSAHPGKHWVTALERNNDKGAQKQFLVQTNWSQFDFDADGTRLNPYENLLSVRTVGNIDVKWIYPIASTFTSSPAVENGVVYIATDQTGLLALNAKTGAKRWSSYIGSHALSSPAVANEVVYIGSLDHKVYAFNARTGTRLWNFTTGYDVYSSPAVANGVVYIGSDDDKVYALNAKTGVQLWAYDLGSEVDASPVVVKDVVYIGAGATIFALNAKDGTPLWSLQVECCLEEWSSPVVADGVLYMAQWDSGIVYALNAQDGSLLWSYQIGYVVEASPAVANGILYVTSWDGSLSALDARTGALLWSFAALGEGSSSSPAVADGVVYVGGDSGDLYALDADTGALLWSYPVMDLYFSSPVVANGTLYVGSQSSGVHAFGLKNVSGGEKSAERPNMTTLRPDVSFGASSLVATASRH